MIITATRVILPSRISIRQHKQPALALSKPHRTSWMPVSSLRSTRLQATLNRVSNKVGRLSHNHDVSSQADFGVAATAPGCLFVLITGMQCECQTYSTEV